LNVQLADLTPAIKQNPVRWNSMLCQLSYYHVLQSYQWGQFKSRHGWSASHLAFVQNESIRGAALVLERRIPRLPWRIMYVPKGPVLDYADTELVEDVLSHLEAFAVRKNALIVKIDPDIILPSDASECLAHRPTITAPAQPIASTVLAALIRRGWKLSNEQVQFKNTLLIDLAQSEEELLARMKPKTRYNIRLAARKGVKIRVGGIEDIESFYQLYLETSNRDHFLIRPFGYYRDAWQSFLDNDMADLLLADWDGKLLAGLLLFRLGEKAWYIYGASSNEQRNLMPNHLLQWEAMLLCKQKDCLIYDLWGAPDILDEADPMWGVYKFKEGLGGDLRCHIGAYDFPAHPILTKLYTWLQPRYIAILQQRHRQTLDPD
jgi:peptidoglycan pentaglycine glycine transferase (the first glycine)